MIEPETMQELMSQINTIRLAVLLILAYVILNFVIKITKPEVMIRKYQERKKTLEEIGHENMPWLKDKLSKEHFEQGWVHMKSSPPYDGAQLEVATLENGSMVNKQRWKYYKNLPILGTHYRLVNYK